MPSTVVDIEEYKPHAVINDNMGSIVVPVQFFKDVINGKRDINDLEGFDRERIIRVVIKEWLDDTLQARGF